MVAGTTVASLAFDSTQLLRNTSVLKAPCLQKGHIPLITSSVVGFETMFVLYDKHISSHLLPGNRKSSVPLICFQCYFGFFQKKQQRDGMTPWQNVPVSSCTCSAFAFLDRSPVFEMKLHRQNVARMENAVCEDEQRSGNVSSW